MMNISEVLHSWKSVIVMMIVQLAYTSMNILMKLAVNDGMNINIFAVYRSIFAVVFFVPIALIFERERPKLTWIILILAFLCGLFGILLTQFLYLMSLSYTSPTIGTAIDNLIPAVTFILAICFRMEVVRLRTKSGKAKVLGTLMGIGGAMILTFYQGPKIDIWSTKVHLLDHGHPQNVHKNSASTFSSGVLLAICSCVTYAAWLIIQTKLTERYPCQCSSTALVLTMGLIQCVVVAIFTERNWKAWKLGWNVRLYSTVYSGTIASGLVIYLISWCIAKRGPVFISLFNPLELLLVALAGSLIFNEKLHCGSIVGGIVIVGGLYLVLWGKNKEIKKGAELMLSQNLDNKKSSVVIDGNSSTIDHQETVGIACIIDMTE